ncbi:nuclear transport factor 2 family protein [Caballeronia sp. LZ002]|uniref:nuclear transport factor 2 family protein n=1 Tax=Caballeronia sp. LZ002 TaxID=3038558 RepID=UPI00286ADAF3|nr:nuclear transport factor 2 family protein [Caballeronia sp. LZ002]
MLSRRARLIDGKHWDELEKLYADDVPAHHLGTHSNKALVTEVAKRLEGVRSIHQLHLPEISLISATTARAITPMEDLLLWEENGVGHWAHGYRHYHQGFTKVGRGWVISDHRLTRQYSRQGTGDCDFTAAAPQGSVRFAMGITPLPRDFP